MTGSLVAKAEGEPTLCSRHARASGRDARFRRRVPARVRGRLSAVSADARPSWSGVAESVTVADVSNLAALAESVVVAGALAFGAWAFRLRGAATKRIGASNAQLEEQRSTGERREGLLRTVVETTPLAIVLFGETGSIIFTNRAARDLFFEGMAVEGENFLSMIKRAPPSLRQALLSEGDELFNVEGAAGRETFHLSRRHLEDGQTLIAVRSVTQEINRHEVASLKKVIRIIGHEINNSLGPISSLVSSAKTILQRPEHIPKLPAMFDRIQERALHLQGFLDGYAQLAKIPPPKPVSVPWGPFLDGLRGFWPELEIGEPPPGLASSTALRFSKCSSTSSRMRMKWVDRRTR